ncbi:nuclear elongation and deformation protein 1 [Massariosphaeria phaeospora]|uniref:Nuclear elongation and deformation protein 1 n=1 Tax=Massariosphaeria phaeospora TaxID=100035 RepID=A0A7C8M1W8_9PLEO|nr:nuclear elongation and deformation protein 1 [Massariosphaeria phaeospora]
MNYVRSITGTVSKGWNSINPATLSGAIDVIVVEQADGTLACSPFHVRFGKYQILRPWDKKVEFTVNGVKQDYAMKLGEGGEAFFVFETSENIPEELQTSPLTSPVASPEQKPIEPLADGLTDEPEDLYLDGGSERRRGRMSMSVPPTDLLQRVNLHRAETDRPKSGDWAGLQLPHDLLSSAKASYEGTFDAKSHDPLQVSKEQAIAWNSPARSASPPPVSPSEAMARAITLSKKLLVSNIPNKVNESGDLMLDMTGYKSSEAEALRAEVVARKILADELEGNYDIGALIGVDETGNLWIYSSEESKAAAQGRLTMNLLNEEALRSTDAVSDPGYHSDDAQSETAPLFPQHFRSDSDSALGLSSPPHSPGKAAGETRNYAKTLRLTGQQLKALDLKPGSNTMSFTVNRSVCNAYMFYWKHDVPILISDIDGTITKSDALGHVLTYIGRDWTHGGVAKLYTDIVNNGYNIFYLTSRSIGQADMTRAYLNGVVQEGYRLPKGPVIMSPDRTIAALRREIYLRKPEVFKMACLRDIMSLFGKGPGQTPFYAGFGNRLTDALSYRSVNIPSTRIFTINSNAEVSLDVLSLNSYKTGYASMREIVDHFFPPVGLLVPAGGEQYTDFNYWRERPLDIADFTDSEDDDEPTRAASIASEDEGSEAGEDLGASYLTQNSMDEIGLEDSVMESVEGDEYDDEAEDEEEYEDESEEEDDNEADTPTEERTNGLDGLVEPTKTLDLDKSTPTPCSPPLPQSLPR